MGNRLNVPALWSKETGEAVAKQQELAADAYSTDQTIEEMRQSYRQERSFWNEVGPQVAISDTQSVPTRHGQLATRRYVARAEDETKALPVILFIHGGGMVVGDLDTHDRICRRLATDTGAAVIAIDYTLSPDAVYPQAVEECADVVRYITEYAQQWNIDPKNLAFAGDSGGANISFGTFLWLRDNDKETAEAVKTMLLFYGTYGLKDSMSARLLGGPWDGLDPASLEFYSQTYLGKNSHKDAKYYNILDSDLAEGKLPACFVLGVNLDPLRDDSRTLAAILEAQGADFEYMEIDGVLHGFLHHGRIVKATDEAILASAKFYRQHAGISN